MSENTCQAKIQHGPRKGELCGKNTDDEYCEKHIRQKVVDKASSEDIRYCDISRGCFVVLEENQKKCTQCLHKARIRDRKKDDKKRQDSNLCLDCGNALTKENRAIGKHNKQLRRCKPCYQKMLKYESQRKPRIRNYKAEAFTNKHIVWNNYVKGAKKRNIDFTLSKTDFNELIVQPCFYCNYSKENEVNGIDRIDNNKGYITDNVVTCCETCNVAKGSQHPQEFIDKLKTIYEYTVLSESIENDIIEKWKLTYLSKSSTKYTNYQKSANNRNIEFKLSQEEFNEIVYQNCYLCGISSNENNKNGIDRYDNNKGYLIENCKPCCGHCNLLKKDLTIDDLMDIVNNVYENYDELTEFFSRFDIKTRESKIEPRNKVINPEVGTEEKRVYKPLDEIIEPKSNITDDIKELLEKSKLKEKPEIKQWKVKQIYEAISTNNENQYKEYCEQNNDMSKIKDWSTEWATFVLSVKGKSQKDSEETIRDFVENLRRIRHNELCYEKNTTVVDREDREQWPATTIVRAFLEGKIDTFKKFTEEQTGDNPENPKWQKSWNTFIKNLEDNQNNNDKLKELCSKFLTAQRTKRYRRNTSVKNSSE